MRKLRFTIGGLMAVVLVAAIDVAAVLIANPTWAGVLSLLTYGTLGVAILGLVLRRGAELRVVDRLLRVRLGLLAPGTLVLLGHHQAADAADAGVVPSEVGLRPLPSPIRSPPKTWCSCRSIVASGRSRPPSWAGYWRGPSSRRHPSVSSTLSPPRIGRPGLS